MNFKVNILSENIRGKKVICWMILFILYFKKGKNVEKENFYNFGRGVCMTEYFEVMEIFYISMVVVVIKLYIYVLKFIKIYF